MTEQLINETPLDVQRMQRKSRHWGIAALAGVLAVGIVLTYLVVAYGRQDGKLTTLAGVIDKQNNLYGQVCKLAGGQINTDPAAREACARVERGEPAVPIPVVITGTPGRDGERGIGVLYTRQIDRCFVEVVLTNGVTNRFGSFCGADGQVGPTGASGTPGPTGESGKPGEPGATGASGPAGVGIATVQAANSNPCLVDVALTDGSVRTIGPFCGPPLGEFTTTDEGGEMKRCVRDGGSDTAPNYTCRPVATPTTTATTTPPLIPTP